MKGWSCQYLRQGKCEGRLRGEKPGAQVWTCYMRCLLDIQMEISSRRLDIQVWCQGEEWGTNKNLGAVSIEMILKFRKLDEIIWGVSVRVKRSEDGALTVHLWTCRVNEEALGWKAVRRDQRAKKETRQMRWPRKHCLRRRGRLTMSNTGGETRGWDRSLDLVM